MTEQHALERQTVLLHFNHRGDRQRDAECVAWPPAEISIADVQIDGAEMRVELYLLDTTRAFHGILHLPLAKSSPESTSR